MDENNNKKRIMFFLILAILLLMFLVVSVSYAVFTLSYKGTSNDKISTGSVSFSYTENSSGISIENSLPMSDVVGKKLERDESDGGLKGFFEFTVSCDVASGSPIKYEIYATKEKVDDEVNSDYIKIYLTDGDTDLPLSDYTSVVPVFSKLKDSTVNNGKILYSGSFNKSSTKKFRLRMWLADTYTVTNVKKTFAIKVNVKASN